MKVKIGLCLAAAVVAGTVLAAKPLAKFDGEVGAKSGWKLVAQEAGKVVYIPFEGYYESKGGRIESGKIVLDKKVGETGYYKLSFDAKAEVQGYWWIDLFDEKGEMLPDINSAVYASSDWRHYDELFTVDPRAAQVQIAFVAKKGVFAKDVVLTRVSVAEAAEWCNGFYDTLPQMCPRELEAVTSNAFKKLPKTLNALRTGKPWKIVLLGDSIMNDTYCGNFTALVQNDFPASNPQFTISVRGSTGCWYYHVKEHFQDYVARHKPDLVVIGGISNRIGDRNKDGTPKAYDPKAEGGPADMCMIETIKRCKAIGAEVVVCSPPPSYEFRRSPEDAAWEFNKPMPSGKNASCLDNWFHLKACEATGVQYWDVTTAAANAIMRSKKPMDWFKRDAAHNDDRGKQLIAQTMAEFFRQALVGAPKGWKLPVGSLGWYHQATDGVSPRGKDSFGMLVEGPGGNWIESPKFALPKKDPKVGGAFYRLNFIAKGKESGSWWIDLFDERGRMLPDINSEAYAVEEFPRARARTYCPVVFAPDARAKYARVVFCGAPGFTVRDISLQEINFYSAAEEADLIYKAIPKLDFKPAPGAFARLPKTLKALRTGGSLRIVMLGDSIMNDCYCGLVSALVKRDFPDSKLEFFDSVRSSSGLATYYPDELFKAYVTDLKPDLVVVGGISNLNAPGKGDKVAMCEDVLKRILALGAEVVITPPMHSEPLDNGAGRHRTPWGPKHPKFDKGRYAATYLKELADKVGAQYWDTQTPVCATIAKSGRPSRWFNRDGLHNNDRGKQLCARAVQMFFREAIEDRAPLAFDAPTAEGGWHRGNYGRLETRLYLLPDRTPGKTDFYRMTFKAKVPPKTNLRPGYSADWCGYCWVDCWDKNGIQLPDMNSQVHASEGFDAYEQLFTIREDAVYCQISLCDSVPNSEFKDVRFEKISDAEAAAMCDRLNATLPEIRTPAAKDAFRLLPRTLAKLRNGEPLRIVMLGDSLMNDTYLGGFPALIKRSFPKSDPQCIISVRGSTGCGYYSDPAHFDEYVRQWKPDLLIIGGISHCAHENEWGPREDTMDRLLAMCASCRDEFETVVQTPPVCLEWRKSPEDTAFKGDECLEFRRDYMFNSGRRYNIAVWECTMGPGVAWAESKKPLNWFKRDWVHLNDRGKHLVTRMLMKYFDQALETR